MPADNRGIRIVVVGREPALRDTYAILLNRAGYHAEIAELQDVVERLKLTRPGVLVMDHTLSKEQRLWLVQSVRQVSSDIRILALHSAARDCGADLVMDSRLGPEAILAGVTELLPRKPIRVWMDSVRSLLRSRGSAKAG